MMLDILAKVVLVVPDPLHIWIAPISIDREGHSPEKGLRGIFGSHRSVKGSFSTAACCSGDHPRRGIRAPPPPHVFVFYAVLLQGDSTVDVDLFFSALRVGTEVSSFPFIVR